MFRRILQRHAPGVVGVAIFPELRRSSTSRVVRRAIAFDGWRGPVRLAGHWAAHRMRSATGADAAAAHVEQVFEAFRIPVTYARNPNDASFLAHLQSAAPDVVFNNQPWRLGEEILALPRLACINRHTSALPEFRGVEPVVHALLHGRQTIGVSMHTMTTAYDAGRLLAQRLFPAAPSVWSCYERAFAVSHELFDDALAALDDLSGQPVIEASPATYFSEPTAAEIARFRAMGLRYL
jgi:methionyl-tRNA formyltransferase